MSKINDFFEETAFEGLQLNEVKELIKNCIIEEGFNTQEFELKIDQKLESLGQEATQEFNQ